jgi:hypothetical protein
MEVAGWHCEPPNRFIAVGDHFVGIHVVGSPGSGLENIHDEFLIQLSVYDLTCRGVGLPQRFSRPAAPAPGWPRRLRV